MIDEFRENISADLKKAFYFAHQINPQGGTCLEFGVFKGRTFIWQLHEIINRYTTSKILGFDSWEGLPSETAGVWCPERHKTGLLSCGKDVPQVGIDLLTEGKHEDKYKLISGFFRESLTKELQDSIGNLIFINIDVDLHSSTVEVLRFIAPLLKRGTIIYFDDWKDPQDQHDGTWGEHLAWAEFTSLYPEINYVIINVNELNQHVIMILGKYMPWKEIKEYVAKYTSIGYLMSNEDFDRRKEREAMAKAKVVYEEYIAAQNGEKCEEC